MGAVTGDHSLLKIVTNATTRPPIAPTMIQGPATDGSSAVRTCAQTHAAGRTTKNNRNAAPVHRALDRHRRGGRVAPKIGKCLRVQGGIRRAHQSYGSSFARVRSRNLT